MRGRWPAGVAILCGLACGKGASPGSVESTTPAAAALDVRIEGPGSVQAAGLPVDCHAGCHASLPSGAAVHLTAVSDAGSAFAGWSGACSGNAACDLTLAAD